MAVILQNALEDSGGEFVCAKVNADEQPELCAALGVGAYPTLIAFHRGKITAE